MAYLYLNIAYICIKPTYLHEDKLLSVSYLYIYMIKSLYIYHA